MKRGSNSQQRIAIGGGRIQTSAGMRFLASVTDFGAGGSMTFAHTQATTEVFQKTTPTSGRILLYNEAALVADFKFSGQASIYASSTQTGLGPPTLLLTAYDTGHSNPMTFTTG